MKRLEVVGRATSRSISGRWRRPGRRSAVLTAVRLLPRAGQGHTAAFALGLLWSGLLLPLTTLAGGALVGAAPLAAQQGLASPAGQMLLLALAAVSGLFVLGRAVEPLQSALTAALARRFQRLVQRTLLRAACRPEGIAHLEDARTADRLAIARGETASAPPSAVVYKLAQVVPPYLQAVGSGVLLAGFHWWAPLLVALGVAVDRAWVARELDTAARGMAQQAGGLRRAGYFRDLALEAGAAKELRIFGLADWVLERFQTRWRQVMEQVWRERQGHEILAVGAIGAMTLAYGVVAVTVALAAARGAITVGQLAVFLGAAAGMAGVAWTADPEWGLRLAAQAVAEAVALDRELTAPAAGKPADGLPRREMRFESVTFRYPGAERDALQNLDLVIPVGQSLAIVGLNGAGKSTLVKLFARLYPPTRGQITVDGQPLSALDPAAWRRRLAVIFQDFARYELSARDNVGFGRSDLLTRDPAAVDRAVERVGARELAATLPRGLDTILSRRYRGGVDLSGGQWQRIALARCFAAGEGGAGVLVLDEPSAALDVRAEAELFDRFLDLTRGLTTILISHRFSTVRRADRIVVLEGGRVAEDGTHAELLSRGGRYATLFRLQAARFPDDGASVDDGGRANV